MDVIDVLWVFLRRMNGKVKKVCKQVLGSLIVDLLGVSWNVDDFIGICWDFCG
jgi:hypothetical protein